MIQRESVMRQRWGWPALSGTVPDRTMSRYNSILETWIKLVEPLVP